MDFVRVFHYVVSVVVFSLHISISFCTIGSTPDDIKNNSPLTRFPNVYDSHLLVHTLDGEAVFVNRISGHVKWRLKTNPALSIKYDNDILLAVDPLNGYLYEYSNALSEYLFHPLEYSLIGYIRRSPGYYKNYLSLGSKSDIWLSIDVNSGKVFQTVSQYFFNKCPHSVDDLDPVFNSDSAPSHDYDVVNLGQTHYSLVLRDRHTGQIKLNISYNTFATHTEADLQSNELQHVATTQPALITFKGSKLLWSLPLSSPVIGLYTISTMPITLSQREQPFTTSTGTTTNSNSSSAHSEHSKTGAKHTSSKNADSTVESNDNTNTNIFGEEARNSPPKLKPPIVLKRVAFTTYALDILKYAESNVVVNNWMEEILQAKFNETLDLTMSLFIGRTPNAPLYALPCLAESTLKPRSLLRASEMYMLEGPKALGPNLFTNRVQDEYNDRISKWPDGLFGLYELPTLFKRSLSTQQPDESADEFTPNRMQNRLKRISDASTIWAVIIPPPNPHMNPSGLPDATTDYDSQISDSDIDANAGKLAPEWRTDWLNRCVTIIFLISTLFVLHHLTNQTRVMNTVDYSDNVHNSSTVINQTSLAVHLINGVSQSDCNSSLSCLPAHFDVPDTKTGWAGGSAEEIGQPEAIRINLGCTLGYGANGTVVYAGFYGSYETAVKRIIRHPSMEKHWRREHGILLRHRHPHLVQCYWTGSTANFHYLVLQRCEISLSELFNSNRNSSCDKLSNWNLTSIQVIYQFTIAVAYLHCNNIVHRDLKPSNILITTNGVNRSSRVVVGDFGLSRALSSNRQDISANSFSPPLASTEIAVVQGNSASSATLCTDNRLGSSVVYDNSDGVKGANPLNTTECTTKQGTASVPFTFGTLGWIAPELYNPALGQLTCAIDVFACGLLSYFVLTNGLHPYDNLVEFSTTDFCKSVSQKSQDSSVSNDCSNYKCKTTTYLNKHHDRQLAITEFRQPNLNILTDNPGDLAQSILSRYLIQSMLSVNPADRPTAEEISYYPIFWPSKKVMQFIADISDIFDARDTDTVTGSRSTNEREQLDNEQNDFSQQQPQQNCELGCEVMLDRPDTTALQSMLKSLNMYSNWVFNKHWFLHLEPEIISDLRSTRGYEDTCIMNLLRAIRNKRNHLWALSDSVRSIIGRNQHDMAIYWTKRFPTLLPILYGLCRSYFGNSSALVEFMPPNHVSKVLTGIPVNCQSWWPITSSNEDNHLENHQTPPLSRVTGKQKCAKPSYLHRETELENQRSKRHRSRKKRIQPSKTLQLQ